MEYDLIRLFDHPVNLFDFIASAIVALGTEGTAERRIEIEWRRSASESAGRTELLLKWDLDTIRARNPLIDRQIESIRERDEHLGKRTELAAIVVATAVMSFVEPETKFTCVAEIGKRHDYYLNDKKDEMIEIAGRDEDGLPALFEQKRAQSNKNSRLRKRWVSVTVMRVQPRNRTEGLHS